MPIKKWEKIKSRNIHDGWKKLDLVSFKMPDGAVKDFEIIDSGRVVISVVGITKDKKVILVKQYRPGPDKIFYEFPLGLIEKGESPLKAARREFLEETGYTGEFKKIGIQYRSAYSGSKVYCYTAVNCKKITNKLKLDKGEFLEVKLFSLRTARQMLKKTQIRNFGEGYLALDYLGLL